MSVSTPYKAVPQTGDDSLVFLWGGLVTPEGGFVCDIFAEFTADREESGGDASPWRLGFQDDGAYTKWLGEMAGRSVVECDATVTSSDRVLVLSTCAPGGEKRFVVMGKLVEVKN